MFVGREPEKVCARELPRRRPRRAVRAVARGRTRDRQVRPVDARRRVGWRLGLPGPQLQADRAGFGPVVRRARRPVRDGRRAVPRRAARTAARSARGRAPATDPCARGAGSAGSRRRHPRPPERDRRRSTDDRGDRRRAVDRSGDRTRTHVRRPAAVRRPGRLPARKTRDRGATAPRARRRSCGRATPPRPGGAARRARDRRHRAGADRPLAREARGLAAGRTLGRQPVLRARDRAGAGARRRGRDGPTDADPEEPS